MKVVVRKDLPETDEYMIEKRRLERRKARESMPKRETGPKIKPPPGKPRKARAKFEPKRTMPDFIYDRADWVLITAYLAYLLIMGYSLFSTEGFHFASVFTYVFYIAICGGVWIIVITAVIVDRIWGIR